MSKRRKTTKTRLPFVFLGILLIGLAFIFSMNSLADPLPKQEDSEEMTQQEFIDRIAPHAQELQKGYGILPSIILGQAILESDWGKSTLASEYNNLFGIKAFGHSKKVTLDTQEFYNEQWVTIQGDFRVYDSWEESMDDHDALCQWRRLESSALCKCFVGNRLQNSCQSIARSWLCHRSGLCRENHSCN